MADESGASREQLRRLAGGDQQALAALFTRYRDRLRRMVQLRLDRRLQGRIDASDVLQEAYLDVARRAADYAANPTMPFFLWLRLLTGQRLLMVHRRHLGAMQRDAGQEVSLYRGALSQATGKVQRTLPAPVAPKQLAWRPDGQLLAAIGVDDLLYVWNVETSRLQAVLRGHSSRPTELSFTPEGDLLASSGWDNVLRLWDPLTGRQVLSHPGVSLARQLPADRRVGLGLVGTTAEVWEVARQEVCRTVAGPLGNGGVWSADFSKDGRVLAFLCGGNSVHLWDWRAGHELTSWPVVNDADFSCLDPTDNSVLTSGRRGLNRWPVKAEEEGGRERLHVGPPELLMPGPLGPAALSADGHAIAVVRLDRSEIVFHDRREHTTRVLGRHEGSYNVALSPDGNWVASAVFRGSAFPIKVRIWDARTGGCVRSLGVEEVGADPAVQFTGDGRWLVTTTGQEYRFWAVGTWEPGRKLERERGGKRIVALGSTRDGSLLAVAHTRSAVQLLDASGNELATLPCSEQQEIFGVAFSPDGRLLAVRCDNQIVHVWDLRRLRDELGKLGLDWNDPPKGPLTDEQEGGG